MDSAIKLNFCDFENFGDALCPCLVKFLAGRPVVPSSVNYANLMAVGSVFYDGGQFFGSKGNLLSRNRLKSIYHTARNLFRAPMKVWGSGFLEEPNIPDAIAHYRNLDFVAVRGQITLNLLRKAGYHLSNDVALGDPGVLYPMLIPDIATIEKTIDIAIVPSYNDRHLGRMLVEKLKSKGVCAEMIDIMPRDPMIVLRQIASSSRILGSAMHALIVADSLGIVNAPISFPRINPFKMRDYYSAYGLDLPPFINYEKVIERPESLLDEMPVKPYVPKRNIDKVKEELLASFPYRKCV